MFTRSLLLLLSLFLSLSLSQSSANSSTIINFIMHAGMIVTKIANPRLWLVRVAVTCFHRHFYSLPLSWWSAFTFLSNALAPLSLSLHPHLLEHLHLLLSSPFPLHLSFDQKSGQLDEKSMKLSSPKLLAILPLPLFWHGVIYVSLLCILLIHLTYYSWLTTLDLLQLICPRTRHLYSPTPRARVKGHQWFTCTRKWCFFRTVQHALPLCRWSVHSTCFSSSLPLLYLSLAVSAVAYIHTRFHRWIEHHYELLQPKWTDTMRCYRKWEKSLPVPVWCDSHVHGHLN